MFLGEDYFETTRKYLSDLLQVAAATKVLPKSCSRSVLADLASLVGLASLF